MKAAAVILAGGMSRRMGSDKPCLPFGSDTMLSFLVRRYRQFFDEVWISVNEAGRFELGGAGELVDHRPGKGPLAGLEAAFLDTDADVVFLTATDIPFGDPKLALRMTLEAAAYGGACLLSNQEPLFGAYARRCLPELQALLDEGEHRMRAMLSRIVVRYMEEGGMGCAQLLNVNDPDAYREALRLLEQLE